MEYMKMPVAFLYFVNGDSSFIMNLENTDL